MNCEDLAQLLPELVDGALSPALQAEAEAALPACPDCQRELEMARQIRTLLLSLQAEYADIRIPEQFEARLLARVRTQHTGMELLDLSSKAFAQWVVELLNLIGFLLDRRPLPRPGTPGDTA
jgi:anti-sigma factor RsiW